MKDDVFLALKILEKGVLKDKEDPEEIEQIEALFFLGRFLAAQLVSISVALEKIAQSSK